MLRFLSITALLVSACGSEPRNEAGCTQGTSIACTCTDGRSGAQVCQADRTFAACDCAGVPGTVVKRVFVTKTSYQGDLRTAGAGTSGIDGADRLCALAATAGSLGGTWKAWISDESTNAIDRISDVGPWFLSNRVTKAFNNKANLATSPLVAINQDEDGSTIGFQDFVWTGTSAGGNRKTGDNCSSWASSSSSVSGLKGDTVNADSSWTAWGGDACHASARLFCIEQ